MVNYEMPAFFDVFEVFGPTWEGDEVMHYTQSDAERFAQAAAITQEQSLQDKTRKGKPWFELSESKCRVASEKRRLAFIRWRKEKTAGAADALRAAREGEKSVMREA